MRSVLCSLVSADGENIGAGPEKQHEASNVVTKRRAINPRTLQTSESKREDERQNESDGNRLQGDALLKLIHLLNGAYQRYDENGVRQKMQQHQESQPLIEYRFPNEILERELCDQTNKRPEKQLAAETRATSHNDRHQ